jgi:hypothetical protein
MSLALVTSLIRAFALAIRAGSCARPLDQWPGPVLALVLALRIDRGRAHDAGLWLFLALASLAVLRTACALAGTSRVRVARTGPKGRADAR